VYPNQTSGRIPLFTNFTVLNPLGQVGNVVLDGTVTEPRFVPSVT
jgi:hypothetical protein